MIRDLLTNKSAKEQANIKSLEIAKVNLVGKFLEGNLEVEILSLNEIEGGVEVFVRAWRNKKQLGFGTNGSVDIERLRIFNPPILVEDPSGPVIVEWIDRFTKESKSIRYREDLVEATKQAVVHSIGVIGKEDTKISKGKIGNTTSTFYPASGANYPCDGTGGYESSSGNWATLRAQDGNFGSATGGTLYCVVKGAGSVDSGYGRSIANFDTSSIPDTDIISSASFSLKPSTKENDQGGWELAIVGATPASYATVVAGDMDQVGTLNTPTEFVTRVAYAGFTADTYKSMALNASGIAWISKTGTTSMGIREGHFDIDNNAPTNGVRSGIQFYASESSGTTNDPVLVVEHAAPPSGPTNLKSYNTNLKANIKSMNTNLIANVKTFDTNA